jgi:hypothetical protein
LTTDEASTNEPDAAVAPTATDAGAPTDATIIDAGFESAPAPKINPVGPCPS